MSAQWLMFVLSMIVYLITGIAAILRVGWLLASANKDIEAKIAKANADFESKIAESNAKYNQDLLRLKADLDAKVESKITVAKDEGDAKRQRIYARFDEYKNFVETNFVRRDMCGLLHAGTASAVEKMTAKMDDLEKKMDDLRTIVLTQMKGTS